jgi:hypothetical protein
MNDLILPPSFFRQIGDTEYVPTEATIGPWSAELQHGGPPSALLTHVLRVFPSQGSFELSRITIELLGPIPLTPCEITVERVRSGRRIELLKAQYVSAGKTFMIAHAWRLEAQAGVSETVTEPFALPALPGPQTQTFFPGISYFPYAHALEWRFTHGSFDTMGPATVWTRPRIALIEGMPIDGLESLLLMIDSANGISAELDPLKWTFVPVDLTVGLYREPIGPWLGMAARTAIESKGIGQTTTTAFDASGSIGHSIHTLFVRPR